MSDADEMNELVHFSEFAGFTSRRRRRSRRESLFTLKREREREREKREIFFPPLYLTYVGTKWVEKC